MVDFTGSWGMTPAQVEDFYHRWREVMLVAKKHDAIPVANADTNIVSFFTDMMERLNEDPWWKLSSWGSRPPVMMFREVVPYDELLFHVTDPATQSTRLVRIQEVVGAAKGFGRFSKIKAPTREGVRPFSTQMPDPTQLPVLQPDTADTVGPPPPDSDYSQPK